MLISPRQIRAARALIDWSQSDLAAHTGLARPTIVHLEAGQQEPNVKTLEKIIESFELAGVIFTANEGVRKNKDAVETWTGRESFKYFFNDFLLNYAQEHGGQIFVSNVLPKFYRMCWPEYYESDYVKGMTDIKDTLDFRILAMEGDDEFPVSSYAQYRWVPKEQFSGVPFYVFGDYVAIVFFMDEPVVFLLKSRESADLYREKFLIQWDSAIVPPKSNK